MRFLESVCAASRGALKVTECLASPSSTEQVERRVDRAHRRYLAAVRTLAQVRKMGGPAVVVMSQEGNTQVNVGGGAVG